MTMTIDTTFHAYDAAFADAANGITLLDSQEVAAVGGGISWAAEAGIGTGLCAAGGATIFMTVGAGLVATGVGAGIGAAMLCVGAFMAMDAGAHQRSR
jgi:hypothetical protein